MHKITFEREHEYQGYRFEINNPPRSKGSFCGILDKILDQLTAMLSHHSKVLVCMEIYHMIAYTPDNEFFSKYLHKLKKRLKRKFGLKRIGLVWVREHDNGETQHYHLALFLDGNKVRSHDPIFKLAEEIWVGWNQDRPVYPPKKSYYLLERGNYDELDKALYHLSYMAKVKTKEKKPLTTNRFDGSRIKHVLRN